MCGEGGRMRGEGRWMGGVWVVCEGRVGGWESGRRDYQREKDWMRV